MLALLAVGGYVIGHDAWTGGTHGTTPVRPTLVANLLLAYPTEWRAAAGTPLDAVLPLQRASVYAPGGRASESGLVLGSLREGEPGPLPRPLVAALRVPLRAAVVTLSELQAYRYSGANVAGFTGSLVLYAIPVPDRPTTVAACYALPRTGADAFMRACAAAIAGASELGQSQSYELAPVPAYARGLHAVISAVEAARARAAGAPVGGATLATVRRLSLELASAFSHATAALGALEAPALASGAHTALERALSSASSAYESLAAAAGAERAPEGQARARVRARAAEAAVDEALGTFALLGYGGTAP